MLIKLAHYTYEPISVIHLSDEPLEPDAIIRFTALTIAPLYVESFALIVHETQT